MKTSHPQGVLVKLREQPGRAPCTTLLGALTLLVALATPLDAAAQVAPPPSTVQDLWKQTNKEAAIGEAEQKREADRLHEEERIRRQSDRLNRLRAALDKNKAKLEQPRQLVARLLQLPATLKLSADNRALAETTLQAQRDRALAAWPAWQEQVFARIAARADDPNADVDHVAMQLSTRALNEAALWFADAEPHASDAVWIDALQREGLCQGIAGIEPGAQMAALIEALPADRRSTAWAGEAARLARWGQEKRTLLAPAERTLEDRLAPALTPPALTKTLAGMPAALRTELQTAGWSLDKQNPAQRCELLRWWSQEQVRQKQFSPRQAMLAWRTALAVRSADFLLAGEPRSSVEALDKGGYPRAARNLDLSGRVFVEQDVDATGQVRHAFIQRRELRAASLGNQAPVALEHELDRATLDRVAAMPPKAPDPAALRDGVATRRVGIEWALE